MRVPDDNVPLGRLLAAALELPPQVTTALSQIIKYLSSFGLADVLTRTEFFYRFTERQHMLLNANTLKNLSVTPVYLEI